jgi:acyl carrier protein
MSTQEKIAAALRKLPIGDAPLTDATLLREDLGLDSANLIELTVIIHSLYGVDLGRRANERKVLPVSVGDLVLLMGGS